MGKFEKIINKFWNKKEN